MAELKLKQIVKRYDSKQMAVKGVSFDINNGEFLTMVGPSGCGKSTTLRMIAGLEDISDGELYIGNRLANHIPAKDREIAMVFQSYALFPHMSVEANIGFGLKIKKVPKEERMKKIEWALDLLDLKGLGHRKPGELSGGQRQRVALGRAMVLDPEVLLLDEPLSNLDAKLRLKMRVELKRLHKKIGSTIIYVTHDQAEAMTLSDRIAIMRDGDLMQIGTPVEVYNQPKNKFVAGFIGSPPMNFIKGRLVETNGSMGFEYVNGTYLFPESLQKKVKVLGEGREVFFGIRPEDVTVAEYSSQESLNGVTSVIETLGSDDYLTVEIGHEWLSVRVEANCQYQADQNIYLVPKPDKIRLFDGKTELTIL